MTPALVTGLIGPNGAGKTTCFNAICGLQSINAGRMTFDGTDMTGLKPHKRARLGIARTFQRLEIFGSLSVRENVLAAAEIRRRWSHDRSNAGANADEVLALVGLTHLAARGADTLPTGQARLLELARSLATRPRLLLLDEPSSGLSDTESEELGDLLCRLAEAGMGVLLVEHDMELVMRVCSDINVLDFGAILMAGTPAEVRADDRVRAAYLGAADDPEVPEDSTSGDGELAGAVQHGQRRPGPFWSPRARVRVRLRADRGAAPASTSPWPTAQCWRCSAPTGRASRPRCAWPAARWSRRRGASTCSGVMSTACGPTSSPAPACARCPTGAASSRTYDRLRRTSGSLATFGGAVELRVEEMAFGRFPRLLERRHQVAGTLSGGEQQMLAMARTLSVEPAVLLLDEISMGLAPMIVAELYGLVAQIAVEGAVVILAEQFAATALSVATDVAVVVQGKHQCRVGQARRSCLDGHGRRLSRGAAA